MDFSGILAGLDSSPIVTACIAVATLVALVYFTEWGARVVGNFFDERQANRDFYEDQLWREIELGHDLDDDEIEALGITREEHDEYVGASRAANAEAEHDDAVEDDEEEADEVDEEC